jgi:polysaccharide transporter, PST family
VPFVADGLAERSGLKRASSHGAAISLSAQMAKFVAQFAFSILLARMLSPQDYGVVAMTAPILAFFRMFVDLGMTQATIQRPKISQGELSFLFWVNVSASVLLGLLLAAIAPLVGAFYGDQRVVGVTVASAALFVVSGLSSQHLALLNRNMAFAKLAAIELPSFLLGAVTGLWCAGTGFGYWSIVITQATATLVMVLLAWTTSPWHPDWPARAQNWKELLGFGGDVTGFNLVNFFARNLDNLLIGRFNGSEALGLYDRAYKLLLAPLTQISAPLSRVALPLLARTQDTPALYRTAFARSLEAVVILTYPCVAFALATHEQLIVTVLGEKWRGVAPIFAILGVGAFFAPAGQSTGWLFMSQNRTRQMRNWGIVSSILFVASFAVGLPWGPIGVASCYIGTGILIQGPMICWAATREGPVGLSDLLRTLAPHALAALVVVGAELSLQVVLPRGLVGLSVLFPVACVTYIGALAVIPGGRGILREFWNYGKPALARIGVVRAH